MTWTREAIESLKGWERPLVRVRVGKDWSDDGRDRMARIDLDGNNPWLSVTMGDGGIDVANRFGWCLILEVLNDRTARPIWMEDRRTDPRRLEQYPHYATPAIG